MEPFGEFKWMFANVETPVEVQSSSVVLCVCVCVSV